MLAILPVLAVASVSEIKMVKLREKNAPGDKFSPGYRNSGRLKTAFLRASLPPGGDRCTGRRGKPLFMGRCIIAGRFIAQCAFPADMHDYYFSIRSTTRVGFHTVLGSPTLPVNEQVISFKMAKPRGFTGVLVTGFRSAK